MIGGRVVAVGVVDGFASGAVTVQSPLTDPGYSIQFVIKGRRFSHTGLSIPKSFKNRQGMQSLGGLTG